MKTPIIFVVLVLVILGLSGCYYQAEQDDSGDQVSYIGEDLGVSEINPEGSADTSDIVEANENEVSAPTPAVVETESVTSTSNITVFEGELVQLKVKGSDPDGDPVTYTFSAPLDESGKWQTKAGDAGDYLVTVTASDGKIQSSKTLKIKVMVDNAPPVIEKMNDITVKEGEVVSLSPKVVDPDGDSITITYSGWMTSSTKKTGYDDSGSYTVTVTASDGQQKVSQNVKVNVLDVNRAPVFEIEVS